MSTILSWLGSYLGYFRQETAPHEDLGRIHIMQASAVGYIINRGRLYWPQIITASFCMPFMLYQMVSQCVQVGPPATN